MNVADLIKEHEGLSLKLYKCPAGRGTVGYGRNVEDKGISVAEAEYLLANDIRQAGEQLSRDYWWFPLLGEVRQAAMVDLFYNLGPLGLSKFVKFLKAMSSGEWQKAGDELERSLWFGQVGRRGPRVVAMVRKGEWP